MTRVTFYKNSDNGLYYAFDIKGHSGYAESGSDIVCSAISSMTMLFVKMIEDVVSAPYDFRTKEEKAEVYFSVKKDIGEEKLLSVSKAIESFITCISWVEEDYGKFVKVNEKNVRV
jgi:uncharacterized protein YsxB (DUF464 family)